MIRVFPKQTSFTPDDELSFVGLPPLFRPKEQLPVRISCVFTWDIPTAEKLKEEWSMYYDDVKVGGPAYGDEGGEFIPELFTKKGITITSRGCNKKCKWCFVPKREGSLRELQIKDGWIVNDNNLLQCSDQHIKNVFDMLRRQPKAAEFKGGIDKALLKDWHRGLLDSIRLKEIWLACDTESAITQLARAAKILEGIKTYKKRCYVLIAFDNETPLEAEKRLEKIYNLGFWPFAQLYQPEQKRTYSKAWKQLVRKWSRPAAFNTYMKDKKWLNMKIQ
jgi:hypothetical protein